MNEFIDHLRHREYMSGVERDEARVNATGEVFTPNWFAEKMIDEIQQDDFTDPTVTYLDPNCGDGNILSEVIIRKLQCGSTLEQALQTTYGVDIMPDNVKLCRDRLLCGKEEFRHIVEQNIVCADSLTYHYRFDGSVADVKESVLDEFFS